MAIGPLAEKTSSQPPQAAVPSALHRESLPQLFARLGSSSDGLKSAQAAQRLLEFGPNEPGEVHGTRALIEFVHFCTNPLVLILLAASVISVFVGELADALIILTIV